MQMLVGTISGNLSAGELGLKENVALPGVALIR